MFYVQLERCCFARTFFSSQSPGSEQPPLSGSSFRYLGAASVHFLFRYAKNRSTEVHHNNIINHLGAASVIWEQLPFIFYFVMQRIDQRKYITTTSSIIMPARMMSQHVTTCHMASSHHNTIFCI